MKQINATEFEELVKNAKGKVVVDFFATWCGPCKMLAPVFEKVSEGYTDVGFYKVDVDEAGELAQQFGVQSIPTLIVFENGEEIRRNVGSLGRGALEEFING